MMDSWETKIESGTEDGKAERKTCGKAERKTCRKERNADETRRREQYK